MHPPTCTCTFVLELVADYSPREQRLCAPSDRGPPRAQAANVPRLSVFKPPIAGISTACKPERGPSSHIPVVSLLASSLPAAEASQPALRSES